MSLLNPELTKQMKHRERDMVPRALVIAMFGLMLSALALVSYAQLTDRPQSGVPTLAEIVKEREITLQGTRSEGVAVLDMEGNQIAFSSENKAGFIDVIWVTTRRERIVQGIEGNPPFKVVRRADGRTAVLDPATGWSIELIGYGVDNVAAFARMLD